MTCCNSTNTVAPNRANQRKNPIKSGAFGMSMVKNIPKKKTVYFANHASRLMAGTSLVATALEKRVLPTMWDETLRHFQRTELLDLHMIHSRDLSKPCIPFSPFLAPHGNTSKSILR
mmetsp:Transcript_19148/g.34687  ORF Transcript_19148/g.34687 Transcript_19148/m.34687 type:complete len:117 (-) Transcript_19148:307-657(-)